jgi:hypothetical protein
MQDTEYNHYLKNLNKFELYLDNPNIPDSGSTSCCSSLAHKISVFVSQLFKRIARLWNYCFGDHHWYSESKARDVIQLYILPEKIAIRNPEDSKKILHIYDRLNQLKNGNGKQSDGIVQEHIAIVQNELKPQPITPPSPRSPVKIPDPVPVPEPIDLIVLLSAPVNPLLPVSPKGDPVKPLAEAPVVSPIIPPPHMKPVILSEAEQKLKDEFSKLHPTRTFEELVVIKSEPKGSRLDIAPSKHEFRHITLLATKDPHLHADPLRTGFQIHANRF